VSPAFSSAIHSAPTVFANAFAIDTVLENIGEGLPPLTISPATLSFAFPLSVSQTHWNLSITCFIIDEGPEK